jgi:predicted PurR-regulated permease PerM
MSQEEVRMETETGVNGRKPGGQFLPMVVGVAAVVVILAGVHGASELISQFLMAFVITVAVAPVQSLLIRRGLGPLWAFLITVVATVVGIGLVITVLTSSINQFVQDLPQYKDEFAALQSQVTQTLTSMGISTSTVESSPADTSGLAASVAAAATWLVSAFADFGFMLGLAAFMLFEATLMPAKVRAIALPSSREPLNRFVSNVRSYVIVTTWVNLLVGAVDTVLLFAMGVPYAVLWGALAFLFGFIPSIGFLLSLVGPALMALLVSGPQAAAIVIVAFIIINGGIQNVILPRRMGEGTDLSPAVVFGSLLFWGFILGPVGAILSVPMTMIVRLSLEFSESTRGLAYLVSSGKHPFNGNKTQVEGEATP